VLRVFLLRLAGLGLFGQPLRQSWLGVLAQQLLALLVGGMVQPRPTAAVPAPLAAGIATWPDNPVRLRAGTPSASGFGLTYYGCCDATWGFLPARFWLVLAAALSAFGSLLLWQAGDPKLAVWYLFCAGNVIS